jgi:hypothetical protein
MSAAEGVMVEREPGLKRDAVDFEALSFEALSFEAIDFEAVSVDALQVDGAAFDAWISDQPAYCMMQQEDQHLTSSGPTRSFGRLIDASLPSLLSQSGERFVLPFARGGDARAIRRNFHPGFVLPRSSRSRIQTGASLIPAPSA